MLFQNLNDFPLSCIYSLITDKSVYVHYSVNNAVNELAKLITKLRLNIHDNKELQSAYNANSLSLNVVHVFRSPPPLVVIRGKYTEIVESYKSSGYKDMRESFTASSYKLKTAILGDYRDEKGVKPLVYVFAKSSTPGYLLLGIFDNMIEANEWSSASFPNPSQLVPQFKDNELTRGFHSIHGMKKIKSIRFKRKA